MTPGDPWAKFVVLGGRLLRIELNQIEDDRVPLGPQAHKPKSAVVLFPHARIL